MTLTPKPDPRMVSVPVEPTDDMRQAAAFADATAEGDNIRAIWAAMLGAAPAQPPQASEVREAVERLTEIADDWADAMHWTENGWRGSEVEEPDTERRQIAGDLRTILAALPVQASDVEPVAWQRRIRNTEAPDGDPHREWSSWREQDARLIEYAQKHGKVEGFPELEAQVRPLYASPVSPDLEAEKARLREAFDYVCSLLPSASGAMDREADTYVLSCMVNVGELRRVRDLRAALEGSDRG